MAKTAPYQLRRTDIRVNSICPGLIETGMTQDQFEYAQARGSTAKIGQLNPTGRFGVPEGEKDGLILARCIPTLHFRNRQRRLVPCIW